MTNSNFVTEVLKGRTLQVDVAAIEDQLRELWKEAAQNDAFGEESDKPLARACVLNLIAYTEDPEKAQRISETIGELTLEHPCRALVVSALPPSGPVQIEAWISAHCHRPSPTSKVLCCEQISLQGFGAAAQQLAPTVVPFLIAELPVFLWWTCGGLFENPFLKNISTVCDRLIVDSQRFTSPYSDFPRLQSYLKSHSDRLAVSDLAWHRLIQWRELAAQFFDAPVFRPHLSNIRRVEVTFHQRLGDGSSVPPQALLLVGWLASRLQWSLEQAATSKTGPQFKMRSREGSHSIEVEIKPTPVLQELAGHLVSFEMSTTKPERTTFCIRKGESPSLAQTEIAWTNAPPLRRVVPLRIFNDAELVARQLEIFGHDPVYEASIAMAAQMVRALD